MYSFAIILWELFNTTFPFDVVLPGADAQKIMTEVVKRCVTYEGDRRSEACCT